MPDIRSFAANVTPMAGNSPQPHGQKYPYFVTVFYEKKLYTGRLFSVQGSVLRVVLLEYKDIDIPLLEGNEISFVYLCDP